jgi:hypothetical protein
MRCSPRTVSPSGVVRHHVALHGEDPARLLHRLVEAPGDLLHRGEEEVADAVAPEGPGLEPVVHELAHEPAVQAQRHQRLAHVARRQDAQLVAQHPR